MELHLAKQPKHCSLLDLCKLSLLWLFYWFLRVYKEKNFIVNCATSSVFQSNFTVTNLMSGFVGSLKVMNSLTHAAH